MDPYVKTTWKKGMIISSDGLNNMEDQIETLTDSFSDVEQAVTDVQTVAASAQTAATAAQTAATQAQNAVSPENLSTTIINTIKEESSPTDIIDVYNGGDPGLVPAAPTPASTASSQKYFLNSEGQWALVETDVKIDWSEVTVGQGINLDTIPATAEQHFPVIGIVPLAPDIQTSTDSQSGTTITVANVIRKDDSVYITKDTNVALHAPSFIGSTFSGGTFSGTSFIGGTFSGDGSNLTNITIAASNITGRLTTEQLPEGIQISPATRETIGGIKVGDGLTIDATGKLDVTASASLPTPTAENQFLVTKAVEDGQGGTTYNWVVQTIPYASSIEGGF